MGKIVEIKTVTVLANQDKFASELSKIISEYQDKGFKVEIQYGFTDNYISALVIARVDENTGSH